MSYLANPITTSKTVKEIKQAITKGLHTNITIKWIKAHVGHYGNELADQLAKDGASKNPIGPEP